VKDGMTNKKTLLVVDDDVEWTDLLSVFFSKKYAVAVANHADQAIAEILREAPQVIILDLIMPSVDGFGLIHRMRELLPKRIPTVLTTGWGGADVKECAESVGCVAVLSKPVSLTELETLVSSLMDGRMESSQIAGSQIKPEAV
jgi:DNA-binding NtrC family response regulator